MTSRKYDLIILDEINVALHFGLLKVQDVVKLAIEKPENTELVFTGRRVPVQIIDIADLVTEMKEIKHYYKEGVIARYGIER